MCAERRGPREVTGRRRGGRNLELSAAHPGATLITARARLWAAAPAENEGATAEHGTGDRSHAPAGAGQSGHGTGTWPCGRVIRTRRCGGAAVGPSEWGAMPGRGRRGLRGVCEALCLPLAVSLCKLLNYALRIRPFSYLHGGLNGGRQKDVSCFPGSYMTDCGYRLLWQKMEGS